MLDERLFDKTAAPKILCTATLRLSAVCPRVGWCGAAAGQRSQLLLARLCVILKCPEAWHATTVAVVR
uniref:Uncharacterized protein n=1 Tax=Hyaloperonospora arabidopsidis (strain Emoy2) TaxID=559515 RepID=M4BHA8_HYAAE